MVSDLIILLIDFFACNYNVKTNVVHTVSSFMSLHFSYIYAENIPIYLHAKKKLYL